MNKENDYWSEEVKKLNEVLKQKGGYEYMAELNHKFLGTPNVG
jgi:UDP:flavonoid glycosyltransferase YjiC (YdhE family)